LLLIEISKKIVLCFILVDELWYRAICVKAPNDLDKNDNDYMVYFLDWGMEYLTKVEDIKKMPKDFIYLPATAYKCYVKGIVVYKNITIHIIVKGDSSPPHKYKIKIVVKLIFLKPADYIVLTDQVKYFSL